MRNIGIQYDIKHTLQLQAKRTVSSSSSNNDNDDLNQMIMVDICYVDNYDYDDEEQYDDDHTDEHNNGNNNNNGMNAMTMGILTQTGSVYFVRSTCTTTTTTHSNNNNNNNKNPIKVLWKVDLNTVLSSSSSSSSIDGSSESGSLLLSSSSNNNNDTNKCWFNITYIESNHTIVALHHNGSIVSIPLSSSTTPPTTTMPTTIPVPELVGEFEYGICTAAWNYDCSVLVLVTSVVDEDDDDDNDDDDNHDVDVDVDTDTNTTTNKGKNKYSVLLSLNTEWDVLAEVRLDHQIDETQSVALCWNNTTTTTSTSSSGITTSSSHNNTTSPQQELIAINSVDLLLNDTNDENNNKTNNNNNNNTNNKQPQRKIRIYNGTTLELHAIGRMEDGSGKLIPNIQSSKQISWAGCGCSNLLTIIETKGQHKVYVAFIEPNGLRHREFLLRTSTTPSNSSSNSGNNNNNNNKPNSIVVTGLNWNIKSDLLAVTLQETNYSNNTTITKVQLWHRSNYHWYMKYEWLYTQDDDKPLLVKFHPSNSYLLCIGFRNLRWNMIHVRWDICTRPCTKHIMNITMALSIDGNLLNMTNFEKGYVPPPMYDTTIPMNAAIHEIATTAIATNTTTTTTTNQQCYGVVSLSDSTLVVLNNKMNDTKASYPIIDRMVTFQNTMHYDIYNLRQLHIIQQVMNEANNDTYLFLLAIGTSWEQTGIDFLLEIVIHENVANIVGSHPLNQYCLTISTWLDESSTSHGGILIQLCDGSLFDYTFTVLLGNESFHGNLSNCSIENLLEPCPWVQCCRCIHNERENRDDRLIIGMSSNGRLYCNDYQISDSISSFTISYDNEFLCFVTTGSRYILRFIPLRDLMNFDPLLGSDENSILLGYEPRYVERGSILISVLTHQPSVVLQMNRGNLEIIYPRALVLRHVMKQIIDMRYSDAFQLMLRQKVDLNLIVDMNPTHFLERGGIDTFVEQVKNIDYLNLFISCLQNWDSTKERYPIPYWIKSSQSDIVSESSIEMDFESKVNLVCRKLREVMNSAQDERCTKGGRSINDDHFLLPILSTFAKENPPKLEDALLMIRDNANKKRNGSSKKPPLFSDTAQNSIQYLAFMADYELLFKTALGLYDYDLARAVARNSQMDPKVYLPQIQQYRNLPLYFGRYQVDLNLKRYELALRNLYESTINGEGIKTNDESKNDQIQQGNDFTEILRLIEVHKLHRVGLEICTDREHRNVIFQSLGSQLLADKKPEIALMVFLSAENIDQEQCIRAAKECRNWSTLFSLPIVSNDVQRKQRLAWEIAEEIASRAEGNQNSTYQIESAARVLLDYGNDLDGAVKMLIRAESWEEAQRISILHQRDDLVRDVVDAAVSYAQNIISDFEDRAVAFFEACVRYNEVLSIRKEAIRDDGIDSAAILDAGDDMSLFSAASNASNLSMRSTTSVGSSTSLSSVISVKSTNSFSLSGGDDNNRHKSKYNILGGGQKSRKTKKKPKGRNKIFPGSEEDLLGIVQTLKSNIVDEVLLLKVGNTIVFLIHNAHLHISRALYDSYIELTKIVNDAKKVRAEASRAKLIDSNSHVDAVAMDRHKVEDEIDALECASLPNNVVEIFSFLPVVAL